MSKESKSIDQSLIRDLANILSDTGLTEIEVEQDDLRIRVARSPAPTAVRHELPAPPAAAQSAPAIEAPAAKPAGGAPSANTITSPMVGTAYLKPDPDADDFVKVGQSVREGQTIMIVEAMKTFNPIAAPRAGTLTGILVEDGQPVEFGEPLATIE